MSFFTFMAGEAAAFLGHAAGDVPLLGGEQLAAALVDVDEALGAGPAAAAGGGDEEFLFCEGGEEVPPALVSMAWLSSPLTMIRTEPLLTS